ncbi:hypothetical protein AB0O32_21925 [Streptomyces rubiginosohelvolus]|uniref:hypothetical protein n=1 Tax=Streptomyces rubiginosohelvolus TaxID=67362 RepID=UPI00341A2D9C
MGAEAAGEQAAAIAAAVGDHIPLDVVTPEQARHLYREQGGFAADNADWLYGLTSYDGVEGATDESLDVTPSPDSSYRTLTDVLGRPGPLLPLRARDHASDFTRTADRTAGPGHDRTSRSTRLPVARCHHPAQGRSLSRAAPPDERRRGSKSW